MSSCVALVWWTLGVGASAWASPFSGGPTSEYARQVTTVQMRSAELEDLLAEARDRLSQLEEALRAQGQSEADRAQSLEAVSADLTALRGRIEVLEFKWNELQGSLSADRLSSERRLLHAEARLRQVEGALGLRPPPPPTDAELGLAPVDGQVTSTPAAPATPAPEPGVSELPSDAAGRLDVAIEAMKQSRPLVARAILKRTIDENTGAPELDEVRYRYAETFFNAGDYARSVSEFQSVVTHHPKSEWACWSYLRQGEAFDKLGKSGKPFFQGATEGACARSAAAKEAKKKLQ
jgi:TolA-binding protein